GERGIIKPFHYRESLMGSTSFRLEQVLIPSR
ncbi:MAG: hypothetical protein ACI865_002405, partial [Flavobacteriaceae bacterium]